MFQNVHKTDIEGNKVRESSCFLSYLCTCLSFLASGSPWSRFSLPRGHISFQTISRTLSKTFSFKELKPNLPAYHQLLRYPEDRQERKKEIMN